MSTRTQPPSRRFPLLLIANLLLILTLACSLPGIFSSAQPTATVAVEPTATPAPPTPTPQPLPPAVVESSPSPGAELPLDGPITLYFNQPMERASVEAALSDQPAQGVRFSWTDDATLVIKPEAALSPASDLTLNLSTDARSAGGMALLQPVSLKYRTVGYLSLTQTLPEADATDVDPTSAVVSAFNRPVVPLGADPGTLPAGFSLEPSAQGRGEWLNTSTYIFYPEPGLEGGKTYTVRLNPDLRGTDGSPLEEAKNWSFSTAIPRLVSIEPANGLNHMRLDAQIVLTFNQPMDVQSVEASFDMSGPGAAPVSGQFEWNEDSTVLTFTPDDLLARASVYTVSLGGQAQARGGTPLGTPLVANYQTVPALFVAGSDPGEGGLKTQYGGVAVYFSAPIRNKDILQYLSLSPAVPNLSAWWNEENLTLNINGDFDPAANYSLTISPNLVDPWGGALVQGFTLNFGTAPLDPNLLVTSGSDVIFLTGQDNSLSVQATNLSNVPLSLGSVSMSDFFTMLGPNGYDFRRNYSPPDQRDWQQTLNLEPNRSQTVNLYVSPDQEPLDPGLYFLKLNLPQGRFFTGPFLLLVSDVQMTFKLSATDALIWAVDLRSNTPVASAPVTIYDENGNALQSGQTDAEGVFQASVPSKDDPYSTYYAMIGQPGQLLFGMALSTWDQGISSWNFDISSDYTGPHQEAYLYTDRPIYRPGQTVYFRAVVRQADNGRYTLPDIASYSLTVYGDMGQEIANFDLPLSAFGSGHGQFDLPPDAQPGYYRLAGKDNQSYSSVNFQVADYRKPEINLQASFAESQAKAGDSLSANINARYFFDAPAGNVPVHWALYSAASSFHLPGYQVGTEDTSWLDAFRYPSFGDSLGDLISEGDAQTDPQGLLSLEFPTESSDSRQTYTLEVTAKDESGLPVSARARVEVNPADFYIGVRPDVWVGQAKEQASFEVQVVDWNNAPAGSHSLRAEFQKVVWVQDDSGPNILYTGPTFKPEYTLVGSSDFATNEQGQARVAFTPPEPGTYQLTISGEGARTEILQWVGGPGQAVWPNLPNQRLRLTADRDSYQPGDTAQIFVPNPFGANALALLTVERGRVLRHQVLTLEAGGSNLSLPLGADDAPNVYVSITLLGRNAQEHPDFRQGYLNLPVAPVDQTLNVTLTSQPQRAGPGDDVTFEIRVTDAAGQPVQGEFSLSVVDLAVLALADPNAPDILPAFYGNQPLGVRTALDLANYAHRRAFLPPGLGGGGGAAAPSVVRENFPDTAYWNADILTDADGRASVSLSLPDSLTTWQVDVRGLTSDTRVGQAQTQVVATKELLVRPVTPRFLVAGDHAQLAAIVQNNTQNELKADVSLQTGGFSLDDPGSAQQTVSLPAGGRARLEWWGTAQNVDSADLVFSVTAGGLQDAARPSQGALPVLHYSAPQTFATAGMLDEGGNQLELVSLPRSFDPQGGNLHVELSPSLAAAMMNALDVLEHYPYECTEQTLSRFLPNLETYRLLQDFGVSAPNLQSRLDRTLDEGLQRLLASQNVDGGWSWWPGGTGPENNASDPFITAYVLFGLSRARQAGVTVSPGAIQNAVNFLQAGLSTPQMLASSPGEAWQLDRLAFEHFALAQAGAGDSSAAEGLFQVRDQLSPWSQALLAITMESLSPGSESARTLISDLESTAIRSATGAHWEEKNPSWQNMSTPVSVSAIVLYALAQRDPGSPLLADAVRYLMSNRQADGAWSSTYSTAWTLMALAQVMKGTGELGGQFDFSAALNGTTIASGQAGGADQLNPATADVPVSSLYPTNPNALDIQRAPGVGRLYYTAALSVNQAAESVAPLKRGITVSREYFPLDEACSSGDCTPVQGGQAGESLKVRVTLTLENAAYYLLVEDRIPAGAEILDTSLKTSQQGAVDGQGQPPLYDPRQPFGGGWGWWYFSAPRIFDDHIAWAADYLPAGTYELTYTLVLLQTGEYRVLPAHAWQFYFPEVQGTSAGALFAIKP